MAATVDAMAFWDESVQGIFSGFEVADEMPDGQCGIWIEYSTKAELGAAWARTYAWDGCTAVIRIRADQSWNHFVWVMAHEFAHAFLGAEHSEDGNVLGVRPGWDLTDAQVAAVRSKVTGGAQ